MYLVEKAPNEIPFNLVSHLFENNPLIDGGVVDLSSSNSFHVVNAFESGNKISFNNQTISQKAIQKELEIGAETILPSLALGFKALLHPMRPDTRSLHAVICISGYFSENYDPVNDWRHIFEFCPNSAIYNYNWSSKNLPELFRSSITSEFLRIKRKKREAARQSILYASFSGANALANLQAAAPLSVAFGLGVVIRGVLLSYKEAHDNAKLAGMLLANQLILRTKL